MKATKTNRIRHAFRNTDEVCHIFAQRKQDNGRSGNVYFEDTNKIYSYGRHYLMGMFHDAPGGEVLLMNEHVYSSSTSQHLSALRSAARHKTIIHVPFPDNETPKDNLQYLENRVCDAFMDAWLTRASKASSWSNNSNKEYSYILETIKNEIRTLETFCKLFKLKTQIKVSEFDFELIKQQIEALNTRSKQLTEDFKTPEAIAKREAEQIKRDAKRSEAEKAEREALRLKYQTDFDLWKADETKDLSLSVWRYQEFLSKEDFLLFSQIRKERDAKAEALKIAKEANKIEAWKNSEQVRLSHGLPVFLRVNILKREVETSHGAYVPLDAALKVVELLRSDLKQRLIGQSIGDFKIDEVNETDIVIGCHTIPLSEVNRVFA
jgi:hypothetical protein